MASSFITINDINGFWVDDSLMQVVCWGLVNAIDESRREIDLWMKGDFREHLFNNAQGIFVGFMHLRIDEFLKTTGNLESIKYCIEQANIFFSKKGEFIDVDELNSFQIIEETKRNWILPLEVSKVGKVLDFLDKLANGILSYEIGDRGAYSF